MNQKDQIKKKNTHQSYFNGFEKRVHIKRNKTTFTNQNSSVNLNPQTLNRATFCDFRTSILIDSCNHVQNIAYPTSWQT